MPLGGENLQLFVSGSSSIISRYGLRIILVHSICSGQRICTAHKTTCILGSFQYLRLYICPPPGITNASQMARLEFRINRGFFSAAIAFCMESFFGLKCSINRCFHSFLSFAVLPAFQAARLSSECLPFDNRICLYTHGGCVLFVREHPCFQPS